jgi:hypothetical protein
MLLRERFGAGGSGLGPTTGSKRFRGRCGCSAIVVTVRSLSGMRSRCRGTDAAYGEVFGIQNRDRYDWKIAELGTRSPLSRLHIFMGLPRNSRRFVFQRLERQHCLLRFSMELGSRRRTMPLQRSNVDVQCTVLLQCNLKSLKSFSYLNSALRTQ